MNIICHRRPLTEAYNLLCTYYLTIGHNFKQDSKMHFMWPLQNSKCEQFMRFDRRTIKIKNTYKEGGREVENKRNLSKTLKFLYMFTKKSDLYKKNQNFAVFTFIRVLTKVEMGIEIQWL